MRARAVSLLQAQRGAGSLALAAAFGTCAVSGELGMGVVLLFLAAFAAALVIHPDTRRYEWAWTSLLAAGFVVQVAQVITGHLDIVLAATQFIVLLAIHRLWHRGSRRDEWLLLLLSLLLLRTYVIGG